MQKRLLSLDDFFRFLSSGERIILSSQEISNVKKARENLEKILKTKKIYGVNTGVGAMLDQDIRKENLGKFQKNLIFSHAAGLGKAFEKDITKAALFLLLNTLKKGYSAIRLETLKLLIDMFNKNLIPVVPEIGSLGASGDLIPLAHLALPLIGQGFIWKNDINPGYQKAVEVFKKEKLKSLNLQAGEAIALINGTYFSTAIAAFAVKEAEELCKVADVAAAITIKALRGNVRAFYKKVMDLKFHDGQKISAANLRFLTGTQETPLSPLQDGYSLRCAPHVHGAVREVSEFAKQIVVKEINSVPSNPVIFCSGDEIFSSGNFHAQPIAIALDSLAIALTTLGNISERRVERLLNPSLSGLPPFLSFDPGVSSGLMILQYTAAALTARNKVLANPASIHSVSVSASQEDFVSLAVTSALKAREILENTRDILAIELICASQAMEFSKIKSDSIFLNQIYHFIRTHIPVFFNDDPDLSGHIRKISALIKNGKFLEEINRKINLR